MADVIVIEHPDDKLVEDIVFKFIRRSQEGLRKFGCSIGESPLPARQMINEAIEEIMDSLIYLRAALHKYDQEHATTVNPCEKSPCASCVRKAKKPGHYVPHLKGHL